MSFGHGSSFAGPPSREAPGDERCMHLLDAPGVQALDPARSDHKAGYMTAAVAPHSLALARGRGSSMTKNGAYTEQPRSYSVSSESSIVPSRGPNATPLFDARMNSTIS